MKSFVLWTLIIFLLNLLNYIGWWGFRYHEFLIADVLTAAIFGGFIAGLKRLLNKGYSKTTKALFLSLILDLLTMPFILHYDITMTLLGKTIGTHPTYAGIFIEGFFHTMKKIIPVAIIFYISAFTFFFISERKGNRKKNRVNDH